VGGGRVGVDSIRGVGNIVVKSRAFSRTWGTTLILPCFFPFYYQ